MDTLPKRAEALADQLMGYAEGLAKDLGAAIDDSDEEVPDDVSAANEVLQVLGATLEAARTAQVMSLTPTIDELEENDDGET